MFKYENYKANITCLGLKDWDGIPAHKYKCKLINRDTGAAVPITYHKGAGHKDTRPTTQEIIQALVLDARAYLDTGTIQGFLSEFGGTREQFNACAKAVEKCARLGIDPNDSAFDEI